MKSLGQVAYEAHCARRGASDRATPWAEMHAGGRANWQAAADAVLAARVVDGFVALTVARRPLRAFVVFVERDGGRAALVDTLRRGGATVTWEES